jgi:hypothetical protein
MTTQGTNRPNDDEPAAPEPVGEGVGEPGPASERREAKPPEGDERTPEEAGYGYGV